MSKPYKVTTKLAGTKLMMFEFECDTGGCGTRFDELIKSDTHSLPCPHCGGPARRLVSTPRFDPRMGLDPGFPDAYEKWGRMRKQRAKEEREYADRNGEHPISTAGADVRK